MDGFGMSITAVCEDCKHEFAVAKGNLKSVDTQVNGRAVTILYYDCPSCGRSHYVQADDDITRYKLEQCTKKMAELMVARNKGTVSKKQRRRFKQMRKDLTDTRYKLMGELTGCKVFVDGREVEMRFSL